MIIRFTVLILRYWMAGQIDNHSLEQVTYELLMEEIKGTDLRNHT